MATSTGKRNKGRGYRLENDSVKLAQELGLEAKRCWGSDGRSVGMSKNVDVVIDGRGYQCKMRQQIADYVIPEEDVEGQIIREDRGKPFVVLPLSTYLRMLKSMPRESGDGT